MRLRLEFEPRDVRLFATAGSGADRFRTFMVRINGKTFNVWRSMAGYEEYAAYCGMDQRYMEEIDRYLVVAMERMLTGIFERACAAVPEGVELL